MFFLLSQAEMILDLLVVDAEHGPCASQVRLGCQFQQPLNGRDSFLFRIAFSCVASGGLVANDLHGVSRG